MPATRATLLGMLHFARHASVALALLAAVGLGFRTAPHDTWLLTLPGADGRAPSALALRTGVAFPDSQNAVAAANVSGWLLAPDGQRQALRGFAVDAAAKATTCALGELAAGVHVATVDTAPKLIKLPAKQFNEYLLHDGLPQVLAARLDAEEDDRDATEQYRKCAKVVFRTGEGGTGGFATPVGQKVEIVPLDDPTTTRPRQTLRVRVLFDGAPLERANLCWDLPGNGTDFAGCTWTDARGEGLVPIAQAGWMTLRLVHMTRPRTPEHEYESFWASCSFVVGE